MTVVTTFNYTGAVQDYTVPAGIYWIQIEWWAAQGGQGVNSGRPGGKGGYTKGTYATVPGTVLHNYVGGAGSNSGYGGWNGGGTSVSQFVFDPPPGGGGGGASDTRVGDTGYNNRIGAAGGGGGSGNTPSGGWGGDGGGANGQTGGWSTVGSGGGAGGTQTTGNAFGLGEAAVYGAGAGGGGGGWWGGHALVHSTSGGGGGSGYIGTLTNPVQQNGVRSGNGLIVITQTNVAPLAPTLIAPATGSSMFTDSSPVFTWTFNDTDPGDHQSGADLRYKAAGAGSWTTIANAATTGLTYTFGVGVLTAGSTYEWEVLNRDSFDLASPWSASSFVTVITTLPAPTIVYPTDGQMVYAQSVPLQWTVPVGVAQDAYQIVRTQNADGTGTLYYDSGTVSSSGQWVSVPMDASAGRTDWLRVRSRFSGHWSPFASVSVLNEFGPPHSPTVVCVADSFAASVVVTISNAPASGGYIDTVSNDLYRTGPDGARVRIATGLPPNSVGVDSMPGSGLNTYTATAYAANGATADSI